MKVAAIQMVSGSSLDNNLSEALRLLRQAMAGAELAVLPEYFGFMGQHDADKLLLANAGAGPGAGFSVRHRARSQAVDRRRHAAGHRRPGSRRQRLAGLHTPKGQCASRYDKIHLFRYDNGRERYDGRRCCAAGDRPTAFELHDRSGQAWRIGQSVCYDLRFAELYRALAAEVLLVPAAFTHTTGQAHWEVLLRARAIENQAYVIASAQGGVHENGQAHLGSQHGDRPLGRGDGAASRRAGGGAGRAGPRPGWPACASSCPRCSTAGCERRQPGLAGACPALAERTGQSALRSRRGRLWLALLLLVAVLLGAGVSGRPVRGRARPSPRWSATPPRWPATSAAS